jgi:hypothetical protein
VTSRERHPSEATWWLMIKYGWTPL